MLVAISSMLGASKAFSRKILDSHANEGAPARMSKRPFAWKLSKDDSLDLLVEDLFRFLTARERAFYDESGQGDERYGVR